jgi:hypothetical protein
MTLPTFLDVVKLSDEVRLPIVIATIVFNVVSSIRCVFSSLKVKECMAYSRSGKIETDKSSPLLTENRVVGRLRRTYGGGVRCEW